jgi:hypothetical protein
MVASKCRRREVRYVALSWLCTWIRGVEPLFFNSNILAGRCRLLLSDRCGFLQLGSLIRYGEAGTDGCIEKCSYFFISADNGYSCGSCAINPSSSPIQATEPSPFDIYLDLDVPVEDRALIRRASERWSNIIRSELADVAATELVGTTPLDGNCRYPSLIDDIYICVQYIDIDGAGGVVARTTILATRPADGSAGNGNDGLPISARIRVDLNDVDTLISQGLFQDVIEHEMAHSLGFGILWGNKGMIEVATDGTCTYTGARATAEYRTLSGGCVKIPNSCGHWDEQCLGRELMTSTLDFTNALSRVTIASMEDLGYDVDYSYADTFGQIEISLSCLVNCPKRNLMEGNRATNIDDKFTHFKGDGNVTKTNQQIRPRQRRRKLSDVGYANAVQYGRDVLLQEKSQSSKQPKNPSIYVLYLEENELYSVLVQST